MMLNLARARIAGSVVTIAVAFCTGCAAANPSPVVPTSAPNLCEVSKIDFGQAAPAELAITSVRQIRIAAGSTGGTEQPVVLRDQPEVPTIRWDLASIDMESALDKIAEDSSDAFNVETYSGSANVDRILQGLEPIAGTHVAYAAVQRKSVPILVTCVTGQSFTGDFSTWERPETGIVTCGVNPGTSAPRVATQVLKDYCR